jgi:hypothetical protein
MVNEALTTFVNPAGNRVSIPHCLNYPSTE